MAPDADPRRTSVEIGILAYRLLRKHAAGQGQQPAPAHLYPPPDYRNLAEAAIPKGIKTMLYKTEYINKELYMSLKTDVDEIIRIIISTIKTAKNNAE